MVIHSHESVIMLSFNHKYLDISILAPTAIISYIRTNLQDMNNNSLPQNSKLNIVKPSV